MLIIRLFNAWSRFTPAHFRLYICLTDFLILRYVQLIIPIEVFIRFYLIYFCHWKVLFGRRLCLNFACCFFSGNLRLLRCFVLIRRALSRHPIATILVLIVLLLAFWLLPSRVKLLVIGLVVLLIRDTLGVRTWKFRSSLIIRDKARLLGLELEFISLSPVLTDAVFTLFIVILFSVK